MLAALAAGLVLVPAAAQARTSVRVGIGDQQAAMFDQPAFQRAKFKRVRYFIAWNAMDNTAARLAARAFVQRARRDGFSVLLHVSSDDLRIKRAKLPSVAQYKSKVGRLVSYFRGLGVREFGTWNEANHASQPTYRSPTRAAQFFREMYRMVKGRCSSCAVVALDVLDQTGVERYMQTWYRALSATFRRRATLVGIHNYGDVNRQRTTFTRNIIRQSHKYNRSTKFWFTETGGHREVRAQLPVQHVARRQPAEEHVQARADLPLERRRARVRLQLDRARAATRASTRASPGPTGRRAPGYTVLRQQLPNFLR